MASKAQRRMRYLRRRAHALGLDYSYPLHVPRRMLFRNVRIRTPGQELELFGETYAKRHADGTIEHLARDMIAFSEMYMLSEHRMQDWQKRVIKDFVRTL